MSANLQWQTCTVNNEFQGFHGNWDTFHLYCSSMFPITRKNNVKFVIYMFVNMLWTSKTVRKWWNLLFSRSLMTTEHCQRFRIDRNNWVVLENHKHKQAIWSSFHHFNGDIRPKKSRFPRIIESNEHNVVMEILSLWNKMFHKRKELACWTLANLYFIEIFASTSINRVISFNENIMYNVKIEDS